MWGEARDPQPPDPGLERQYHFDGRGRSTRYPPCGTPVPEWDAPVSLTAGTSVANMSAMSANHRAHRRAAERAGEALNNRLVSLPSRPPGLGLSWCGITGNGSGLS